MKKQRRYLFSGLTAVMLLLGLWSAFSSFSLFNRQPVKAEKAADIAIFSQPPDLNTYYWIELRIKIDTKNNRYSIIGASNKIYDGYIKDFEKALWKGLSKKKIIVGPFIDMPQARLSRTIYQLMARVKKPEDINKIKWPEWPNEIYYFNIEFEVSHRLRIFMLKHTAAAVESGSVKSFVNAMFVGLQYKKIAIGPFEEHNRAEEVKRLYRQNE